MGGTKMLSQEEILEVMKKNGVLFEGHFRLSSGRHAARYLQCAQLLQYPHVAGPLCEQLAQKFAANKINIVIGPATGAIILAYEVARALGAKALFTERDNGEMTLRRGFTIDSKDNVLVVEDIITTGGSTREVMKVVQDCGANIVGVGAIADRSGGKVDLGVPIQALVTIEIPNYLPEECPLCKEGIPIVKPGSRPEAAV